MNRRQFLRAGATAGAASLAGCALRTSTESSRDEGIEIRLEPAVSGLTFPTNMVFLPTGNRFVSERFGLVLRATDDGLVEQPVLDLTDRLAGTDGEKGLVGMALHPEFSDTRKLYIRYSGKLPDSLPDAEFSHVAVLSEFEVRADASGVVPDSERRILEVPEPGPVHNAGALAFGPDGYLYVALGDGQRTNLGDEDWSWWYDQGQAAQNTTDNLLGGILRLDVDDPTGDRGYGIPPDNPLVGEPGRDEYYAWGLRNPYRISFDGDRLFVADVGEHTRESVYLTSKGANHGWPVLEGSACTPSTSIGHTLSENPLNVFNPKTWQALTNRVSPVKVCPTPEETDRSLTDPIVQYRRSGARSVTGGYVYRGGEIPALQGSYLFGDFVPPAPLMATDQPANGGKPWPVTELVVAGTDHGRLNDALLSFARDPAGELYVLTTGYSEGTGRVRRLTAAT
ncbi:MAG: PQQ-dependent sugar dehydrogenase [Halovenus sp.]